MKPSFGEQKYCLNWYKLTERGKKVVAHLLTRIGPEDFDGFDFKSWDKLDLVQDFKDSPDFKL
jgi:hypothetical protein